MDLLPGPIHMDPASRARVRWAAFLAPRLYPDPVGMLLARELFAWENLGYIGGNSQIYKLTEFLIAKADAEHVEIVKPAFMAEPVPEAGVP